MSVQRFDLVIFDYWNTLVHEARPGALLAARLPEMQERLAVAGFEVSIAALTEAHRVAQTEFEASSSSGRIYETPQASCRMAEVLGLPAAAATPIDDGFVVGSARAEVDVVVGVVELLGRLAKERCALAIVCDVGLTPSTVLVAWLADRGLLGHFDSLAFSDVIGEYKPGRRMFDAVMAETGVADPARVIHVGDSRRTDVGGARRAGIHSVRFAGIYDDRGDLPEAQHVVRSMAELSILLLDG